LIKEPTFKKIPATTDMWIRLRILLLLSVLANRGADLATLRTIGQGQEFGQPVSHSAEVEPTREGAI
jgi:hypothetical protein